MLTHLKTPILLANIEDKNKIIESIYYDDLQRKKKEIKLNQCPHCFRQFGRRDTLTVHLRTCRTKMEQMLKMYEDNPSHFRHLKIDKHGEQKLKLAFPLPNEERLVMIISGANGCGKSTFIRLLLLDYFSAYKNRDFYLFSTQEYDTLDVFPNLIKISLDESFLKEPLTLDALRNSICIFDDVDSIRDKKIQKAVDGLKHDILKNGRFHTPDGKRDISQDIDVIITNHMVLGGHETKAMIHESFYYVLFPQGTTAHSIDTICKKYAGLDKEQTQKVIKNESRAVIIHKNYPKYVLTDKEIFLV